MIQKEIFTAKSAVEAGLIEAVKSKKVKISGSYELDENGFINFKQNEFKFVDKHGNLRYGKFKTIFHDMSEVNLFSSMFLENQLDNGCV